MHGPPTRSRQVRRHPVAGVGGGARAGGARAAGARRHRAAVSLPTAYYIDCNVPRLWRRLATSLLPQATRQPVFWLSSDTKTRNHYEPPNPRVLWNQAAPDVLVSLEEGALHTWRVGAGDAQRTGSGAPGEGQRLWSGALHPKNPGLAAAVAGQSLQVGISLHQSLDKPCGSS
jgi:hypothetical protein